MLFNKQGAGCGIISGLGIMLWIGVGAQVAKANGFLKLIPKSYSTEGCTAFNLTSILLDAASENLAPSTITPAL